MKEGRDRSPSSRPSLEEKVAFLSSSKTHGGVRVEVRETHMAFVFLAGSTAYKLKKPVRLPHLDYSTLAARGRICAEEVRLNRRLAPDVYLGRARLVRAEDGTLSIDGSGRTVEWLVMMRRLPEDKMLDQSIEAGSVGQDEMEMVARRLSRFYLDLPEAKVDSDEHVSQIAQELAASEEIFTEFEETAERGVAVSSALRRLLEDGPEILTERVVAGRIVEGHGDLRPEHVCLEKPPVVIDCLEFSSFLRRVDPFDELAFLSMECAVLGARWIGPMLIDTCAKMMKDRPSRRQLAFYTGYRAGLRARQAVSHLLEAAPRDPDKWVPLAQRYLDEAEAAATVLFPRGEAASAEKREAFMVTDDSFDPGRKPIPGLREDAAPECLRELPEARPMRLFALGDARDLGESVAGAAGCELSLHEERDFGDGEHKTRPLVSVRGADVFVIHALASEGGASVNDRLVKLLFFLAACREHGAAQVTAVVPYLAYARKERQTKSRDPVSTRYVAQLFEAVGMDRIVTLDVHSLPAFQNAFRCRTVHLEARSLFAERIRTLAEDLPVTVLSPDSGAVKRAELLRCRYEEMTGGKAGFGLMEKHRSAGRVTGELFAGDVAGSAVFIIDDMISSGGTVKRAAEACRDRGAKKVFALSTHGLFSRSSLGLFEGDVLDRTLVTDSVPAAVRTARELPAGRLEIVPAAPLIGQALERLHASGSISDLLGAEG